MGKSGIPKRKKAKPKPRFPAKSITAPAPIDPIRQRISRSSRTTEYQYFFDESDEVADNFDDGAFVYTLGLGFIF